MKSVRESWNAIAILSVLWGVSVDAGVIRKQSQCQSQIQAPGVREVGNQCLVRSAPEAWGITTEIECLLWRAENHGYNSAFEVTSSRAEIANRLTKGLLSRPPVAWRPGVRLTLGVNTDYDRWDLCAAWTWYLNHKTTIQKEVDQPVTILSAPVSSPNTFLTKWPVSFTPDNGYFENKVSWQLRYNVGDLELGRAYYITRRLAVRPHCGARGAQIHQTFSQKAGQTRLVFNPLDGGHVFFPDKGKEFLGENDWWGVGPRAGFQGSWELGFGLQILGKASASLLYGQSKVFFENSAMLPDQVSNLAQTFTSVLGHKFRDSFYQLVPNGQIFIGVGWQSRLKKDRYLFGLDVGWEANYWGNQFNIPVVIQEYTAPVPSVGNQPVTLEGVTIDAHFDF